MDIIPYLRLMVEREASDIYFTVGTTAKIKLNGKLVSVGKNVFLPEQTENIAKYLMNPAQWVFFEKHLEVDTAYTPLGMDERFRVNVFTQQKNVAIVMRHIRSDVPSIDSLRLPEVLKELITPKRGLVLMTGATNSGKSTTLAAMLDYRNIHQAGHILTIEDPIEFIHEHKKSLVNQREIGIDTHSYANALKSAMRESPDVILIGEVRDRETMETVLTLSNTGHLVISTLHANSSFQAIQRIINMFEVEQHQQLFTDLSLNLVCVLSQRLVVGVDQKRIAALEIMINTPHIADLILNGKTEDIKEAMETSGQKGVQTFDIALYNLYRDGMITLEEALTHAHSRMDLEAKINFG
ncbi:PilT/PilU family type 4a pilus ATPase [Candidatus Albibeggiatoa sp. nov. BB20]|uniref:PilT/PilU family type 4a pilus ATPase n=1 Tax=Candidatus Albibeggiatoa sp. nov. BB20 TaxID=3162723 RepID=UPI0033658850